MSLHILTFFDEFTENQVFLPHLECLFRRKQWNKVRTQQQNKSKIEFYSVIKFPFFEVIQGFQITKPALIGRSLERGHGQSHLSWKTPKIN